MNSNTMDEKIYGVLCEIRDTLKTGLEDIRYEIEALKGLPDFDDEVKDLNDIYNKLDEIQDHIPSNCNRRV